MQNFSHRLGRSGPRRLWPALLMGCVVTLAQPARADIDWSTADWGGYSPDALTYWQYREATQRTADQMQRGSTSRGNSPATPPLSTAGNVMRSGQFKDVEGFEQLARMYPREQFYQRTKQYRLIVESFNENVEKLYGVPPNNLATAMTVALAGAYSAYHNKSFPDAWVKRLYRQMEERLLEDPRLAKRSVGQKATDYQVMVGVGMVLLLTQAELQKTPNAAAQAQLRRTGGDALRALAGANPDQVQLSSSGLRVR